MLQSAECGAVVVHEWYASLTQKGHGMSCCAHALLPVAGDAVKASGRLNTILRASIPFHTTKFLLIQIVTTHTYIQCSIIFLGVTIRIESHSN